MRARVGVAVQPDGVAIECRGGAGGNGRGSGSSGKSNRTRRRGSRTKVDLLRWLRRLPILFAFRAPSLRFDSLLSQHLGHAIFIGVALEQSASIQPVIGDRVAQLGQVYTNLMSAAR